MLDNAYYFYTYVYIELDVTWMKHDIGSLHDWRSLEMDSKTQWKLWHKW